MATFSLGRKELHGDHWATPGLAPNEFTVSSCVVVGRFHLSKNTFFLLRNISEKNYVPPTGPSLFRAVAA